MLLDVTYLSFIAFSVICGLIFTKRASHQCYKIFLIVLILTTLNETGSFVVKYLVSIHKIDLVVNTHPNYNVFFYMRFPLMGMIFQSIFTRKNKLVYYFINSFYVITILMFFVCYNLYDGINKIHTVYYITGGVFVIINCLLLFYQSINNEEIVSPFEFPFFLSAVALFLLFLGVLPFMGMINFLAKYNASLFENQVIIIKSLNVVFYSLISFDYYQQWKRMKSAY